jgi:hypothetical protein
MGDALIFVRTATFNMDVASFFTKWMRDVTDGQTAAGAFGDVSPSVFESGAPAWGDAWEDIETTDYAVQLNYTVNNFTIFGKFTGTDGDAEVETDVNNNEPRFLVGVTTTLPWGE